MLDTMISVSILGAIALLVMYALPRRAARYETPSADILARLARIRASDPFKDWK